MMQNPNDRLDAALELLGYKEDMPSHYRGNLLHSIQLFASLARDQGLEWACEARINCIRAENEATRSGDGGGQ